MLLLLPILSTSEYSWLAYFADTYTHANAAALLAEYRAGATHYQHQGEADCSEQITALRYLLAFSSPL